MENEVNGQRYNGNRHQSASFTSEKSPPDKTMTDLNTTERSENDKVKVSQAQSVDPAQASKERDEPDL